MVIKEKSLGQHFLKIEGSCKTRISLCICQDCPVPKDNFSSRHVQLIVNLPGSVPAGSTLKF